jgi:CheY-like chemotaxis protein
LGIEKMNQCKTVLVVDDDPAIRSMLQDVLEIYGYDVFTAADGEDGIATLSAMKNPPCVILLDLMMPGMNGWGFLDFQRANPSYSKVPVVICSAYEASARSVGSQRVLIKPVQLDSLVGTIKSYCA